MQLKVLLGGTGHDRAVKGGYLREWNQVGLDTIKEAKKKL